MKEFLPHSGSPSVVTDVDPVNPSHYRQGKVECIDAIESATVGLLGIEAYYVGQVIKYVWRWKLKGGSVDLKKAAWNLDRLLLSVEQP